MVRHLGIFPHNPVFLSESDPKPLSKTWHHLNFEQLFLHRFSFKMFKNVYNALWTPQNRPTIKMNWRGKLKARLIPNIFLNKSNLSKTEIENELESESGIFLLKKTNKLPSPQLLQCTTLWDSPSSLWGIFLIRVWFSSDTSSHTSIIRNYLQIKI